MTWTGILIQNAGFKGAAKEPVGDDARNVLTSLQEDKQLSGINWLKEQFLSMAGQDKKVEKSDLANFLTSSVNEEFEKRFDEQSRTLIFEAIYGTLPDRFDLNQFMKESRLRSRYRDFDSGEPNVEPPAKKRAKEAASTTAKVNLQGIQGRDLKP